MKKIILLAIALWVSFSCYAQEHKGVNWEQGTLQDALRKAAGHKKGAKLVFLDCYTTWCGPCKYMANTVFTTEAAGNYFNEHFVNIKIDMEKGEGPELAKKFRIPGYPTFIILSPDGKEIGRVVGSNELEPFIADVERARDVKNSVSYLKTQFEKSPTSDNAVNYVEAMGRNSMYSEITRFMNENLAVLEDWTLFSDKMWKYVKLGISYDNRTVLNCIIANKMQANSAFGTNRVNKALRECYKRVLTDFLTGKRTLAKEEAIALADQMNMVLDTENYTEAMLSKLARWEVTGNEKAISGLFKYGNLRNLSGEEMLLFEEIFSKYDCITKEMLEKYYQSKKSIGEMEAKRAGHVEEQVIKGRE